MGDLTPWCFRGWPLEEYSLPKIVVLGHDGKSLLAGVLPERCIGGAPHSELPWVRTAGKLVGKQIDQTMTKILVKQ
jgi:hypothetical protein